MLTLTEYQKREMRLVALAAQMRKNGLRVDVAENARRVAIAEQRKERGKAILVGYGMPTHKPPTKTQVKQAEKAGLPAPLGEERKAPHTTTEGRAAITKALEERGVKLHKLPKTETGQISFSGENMTLLARQAREHEAAIRAKGGDPDGIIMLAETVADLAEVRVVYHTVAKHLCGDRVHPSVDMLQASGRWSITDPGLTVFGKRGERYKERGIFLADEGQVLLCFDFDQVDARAVAVHSQDPAYMAMFGIGADGKPLDAHMELACTLWGEEVRGDRDRRNAAKPCGHGYNYGLGAPRLAENAKITVEEAAEVKRILSARFPGVVAWQEKIREIGRTERFIDNGFGRKVRIDPEFYYTQSPAGVGQATARDIMMEGLLDLPRYIRPMLRTVVHDEAVFSVPTGMVEQVTADVLGAFQREWAPPGSEHVIRFTAGVSRPGERWSDCYEKAA